MKAKKTKKSEHPKLPPRPTGWDEHETKRQEIQKEKRQRGQRRHPAEEDEDAEEAHKKADDDEALGAARAAKETLATEAAVHADALAAFAAALAPGRGDEQGSGAGAGRPQSSSSQPFSKIVLAFFLASVRDLPAGTGKEAHHESSFLSFGSRANAGSRASATAALMYSSLGFCFAPLSF